MDSQDLTHGVFTDDYATSAQNLGTLLQRGNYTLTTGKQFVTFARYYTSANNVNNISLHLTPKTAPGSTPFIESLATAVTSKISGFTVSGSGSDTGYWFAVGYK